MLTGDIVLISFISFSAKHRIYKNEKGTGSKGQRILVAEACKSSSLCCLIFV